MEKKYYVKDIKNLKNYDFSERLKLFVEKSEFSQSEFCKKCEEKSGLSKKTFQNYFANKNSSWRRKKPQKDSTVQIMAELLNIPQEFLNRSTEKFENFFDDYINKYIKRTGHPPITIDIEDDFDVETQLGIEPELLRYKDKYFEYFEHLFKMNNPNDKEHEKLYLFTQYLLDNFNKKKPNRIFINEKVYTLLHCFRGLNDIGQKKLIKYGNFLIDDVLNYQSDKLVLPRNSQELEKTIPHEKKLSSNILWGKIKHTPQEHYTALLNLLEEINDLEILNHEWDIFLVGMNLDKINNDFFPEDALESYVLIADLFSLDEDFQSN